MLNLKLVNCTNNVGKYFVNNGENKTEKKLFTSELPSNMYSYIENSLDGCVSFSHFSHCFAKKYM